MTAATTDLKTESKIQHSEQFSHGVASHRGLHPEVPVKYGVANIVNFVTVEGEPVRMSQGGIDTYAEFHSASFAASCIARRREAKENRAEISRLKEENERLEKKNKKLDEGCRVVAQVLADTAEEKAKILQDAADIGGEIREVIEAIPDHLRSNWCNKASDLSEKLGWLGTPFNETSEF